jgi:hypothetical protein
MIKAKLSHTVDFDLSASEAKDITIKYICAVFNWDVSYLIRLDETSGEEWVFQETVVYSSHSFKMESKLRKATDTDKIVYKFLQEMLNASK